MSGCRSPTPSSGEHQMYVLYCPAGRRASCGRSQRNWGKMMSITDHPRSTPHRRTWQRGLALFAAVGLVVAACGDDDDDNASSATTAAPAATTAEPTAEATTAPTTAAT